MAWKNKQPLSFINTADMDEEDYYIFNYCLAMDSAYFDRGLQGMTEIADEYLDEMIRRNKDIRDK